LAQEAAPFYRGKTNRNQAQGDRRLQDGTDVCLAMERDEIDGRCGCRRTSLRARAR
jgi:hypothetical protein